ncbi:hypothetical protein BRYFOR_05736 [Marvinbryantia formatexigens DSM 14469]|uniref:Uncharacterized protein n=1 Tax=Marvinbryantia formatexigens DSM 14469 TaxID=478749 RepID=C6LAU2_9FIRM|nr:hypothetical protein BRYFOR_05736 [Marvinbryantia formatexigens DSM 14469]
MRYIKEKRNWLAPLPVNNLRTFSDRDLSFSLCRMRLRRS